MNFDVKSFVGQTNRQAFKLVPAAAMFAVLAGASQAQSLYPELVKPLQTADVIRNCTQLEIQAGMARPECGTMTLADVRKRLAGLTGQQEPFRGGR